jgi:type IV pilus assembly protein PilV
MKPQLTTSNKATGYTLIEILIAVAILGVGVLGMAGIQLKGMRGTQNSFLRTDAVTLANNMAERMTANPMGVMGNDYLNIDTSTVSCATAPSKHCSSYNDNGSEGAAVTCNPQQMAQYDKYVWACGVWDGGADNTKGGIKGLLPNGKGQVTCSDNNTGDSDPCTAGSPIAISIEWTDVALDSADPILRTIVISTAKTAVN